MAVPKLFRRKEKGAPKPKKEKKERKSKKAKKEEKPVVEAPVEEQKVQVRQVFSSRVAAAARSVVPSF